MGLRDGNPASPEEAFPRDDFAAARLEEGAARPVRQDAEDFTGLRFQSSTSRGRTLLQRRGTFETTAEGAREENETSVQGSAVTGKGVARGGGK